MAVAGVASLADAEAGFPADSGVASLADAGVTPLADAWVVSLVDAGVATLAEARVASLVDFAGSVAGGVTAVSVCARTEEMTFLHECVVWDRSIFNNLVYYNSKMDCGDCALPDAWCQEMPGIRDDSVCQYVNCVGCDLDFVEWTVPEGGDVYPVGTLSSEPLYVNMDDMTYQERIEALSGTIYDYDDMIDNQQGYFDYDDPCDYGEWCDWDDPVENGTCYDPYRSDVAGGRTAFSRVW